MNTTQNSTKSKIVKVIGVDLAKDHCDVIGYDENGKICLRLDGCSYAKLREILSNLPQAVVLMEACKGSMFHARSIADLGHEVRLVKGADVKALRNVNHKNDLRDAAYIAKLYFVPGTTYVYIKSQQQQSLQFLQNEYIHGQLPVCKCSGDFLGTTPPGGRVHARPPFNTWRSHTTKFGLSRIRVGNSCAESNRQTVVE